MPGYDIVLRGGRIIDASSSLDMIGDVGISDGLVAYAGPSLSDRGRLDIDCTGLLVLPGLIDMHTHSCPVYPRRPDALPAFDGEAFCLRCGVTTAVDAGTCGIDDFPSFYESTILTSRVRLFAFLNIARGGMVRMASEQEPEEMSVDDAVLMAREYRDVVVGFKSAHYRVGIPFDDIHTPWLSIDRTVEAGERASLPVMIDMQPNGRERTYRDFIEHHLRPGDIHTHVYAQQFDFLDEAGHVMDYMFAARERGIRFDLGHGRRSFWFRKCIPSLEDGFMPDTISTDIYSANVLAPVQDMLNVMSKLLSAGMPLHDVIAAVTVNPAAVIGHRELGTLSIGSAADVAVLSLSEGDYGFEDGGRASMRGRYRFGCEMTLRDGQVVFDRNARAAVDWRNAPSDYWIAPSVIGGDS